MGTTHTKYISKNIRLNTKTAIVTGSNTGIGKVTAKEFYKRGARVVMACRNREKANQAVNDIKKSCAQEDQVGELLVADLDLTNLKSIRNCAQSLLNDEKQINILVNNAGIMMCPKSETSDGFETQFGTNHLGHFLFTLLLLPVVGRINFDDLNFERSNYSAFGAYSQSKLANILFTKELARRLEENCIYNVSTYSVHPGVISTELGRYLDKTYFMGLSKIIRLSMRPFFKSAEEGAQTIIYCAISPDAGNETGLYYYNCEAIKPSAAAESIEDAKELWEASKKLLKLDECYNPFTLQS
ncbi:hypothetical protein RI129_000722 [Pyrocoelia pectoralis]|uniref:Uncharacterized protein n=1 Tax=Pyrocoelia pectoralis TaxID=417401 RepID=A0AAN7VUV9_9COLE